MTSKLRVLHVLHDLSGGGAERLVLDLCRKSAVDIEPVVAVLREGGELSSSFAAEGIPVKWAGGRKGRLGIRALGALFRWSRCYDIIHTHLWSGDFYGGLAGRLAHRPVVSTVHNTRGDGRIRDGLLKHCVSPNTKVAVSPAVARFVSKHWAHPDRVEMIANGVDLTRFAPSRWTPGPPWHLLVVGRLTEQKGIDRLINSLAGIQDTVLHVVGRGEEQQRLKALAESKGVSVQFHGWVSDVNAMYRQCHVLVMPSRWEGFGLTAVEAMASGRPVLSSAVDGLDEVLGDVGIRFDGTDLDDVRRTILQSLAHPEELAAKAKQGPGQAAQFSVESTVHSYESLYRQLASKG